MWSDLISRCSPKFTFWVFAVSRNCCPVFRPPSSLRCFPLPTMLSPVGVSALTALVPTRPCWLLSLKPSVVAGLGHNPLSLPVAFPQPQVYPGGPIWQVSAPPSQMLGSGWSSCRREVNSTSHSPAQPGPLRALVLSLTSPLGKLSLRIQGYQTIISLWLASHSLLFLQTFKKYLLRTHCCDRLCGTSSSEGIVTHRVPSFVQWSAHHILGSHCTPFQASLSRWGRPLTSLTSIHF